MTSDIERLRELLKAAMGTPWEFLIDGDWPMVYSSAFDEEGHRLPVIDLFHGGLDYSDLGYPIESAGRALVAAVNALPGLLDENERLREEARFGARLFDLIFERFCEGQFEIEISDIVTGPCVDAGMVEKIAFDPEQHIDTSGACEPGDDYWHITVKGRAFLAKDSTP